MIVVIAQALVFAIFMILSPTIVLAVIVMLLMPDGRKKTIAFVAGWFIGIFLVALTLSLLEITLDFGWLRQLLGRVASSALLQLVIGLFCLVQGSIVWYRVAHPPAESLTSKPEIPKWIERLGQLPPVVIGMAGFAAGGLSPKNLALLIILSSILAEANLSSFQDFLICLMVAVVGSLGVAAPVVVALYLGEKADKKLEEWQTWLIDRAGVITVVILLFLGVWLTFQGLTTFR